MSFFYVKTEFGHFVGKQSAITYYDVSFFIPPKVGEREVEMRSRLAVVSAPDATNLSSVFHNKVIPRNKIEKQLNGNCSTFT